MKKVKNTRESGIELLRIFAMMGVVILHYNNVNMGQALALATEGSINQYIVYFFENLSVCGVNIFILISGYYMCKSQKRMASKVFELFLQVILFKIAFYILSVYIGMNIFSIRDLVINAMPNNYYVILYCALFIISPYINIVLTRLSKAQLKNMVICLFVLFSVWTIIFDIIQNVFQISSFGLSTVGMYGTQEGYTIVNFILVYIIGAYIRICEKEHIDKRLLYIGVACILALITVMSILEHKMGYASIVTWNYNNPLVIILSAGWFIIFKNIHFRSRVINELAKGSFTCFLVHGALLQYLNIPNYINGNIIKLVLHVILCSAGLYVLSYIVYKIYSLCTDWFIKLVSPAINRINLCVDIESEKAV